MIKTSNGIEWNGMEETNIYRQNHLFSIQSTISIRLDIEWREMYTYSKTETDRNVEKDR